MGKAIETLKSLRLLYSLLMTVSTAIFVFVLTPDDSAKYKSALTELSTLSQLNTSTYYWFVHNYVQEAEDRENVRIISAAQGAGLSVAKPVRYHLPAISDRPPDTNDLYGCDAFLRTNQVVGPFLLIPATVSSSGAFVKRL